MRDLSVNLAETMPEKVLVDLLEEKIQKWRTNPNTKTFEDIALAGYIIQLKSVPYEQSASSLIQELNGASQVMDSLKQDNQ